MDRVYDSFEKTLLFIKSHESWYDWRGESLQRTMDLYNDGFLKVLKNRDSEGRRILHLNNWINLEKYNADDIFRLTFLILTIVMYEEETQFCGIVVVDDFGEGVSMKYLSMFSIHAMYDIAIEIKSAPIRVKSISVVGLPAIGTQLLNGMKMGLSEKMKERLNVLSSRSELWKHVDQSNFTKDLGGDASEQETIDNFKKTIDEQLAITLAFVESIDIDAAKATALKNVHENIGSFRKLDID